MIGIFILGFVVKIGIIVLYVVSHLGQPIPVQTGAVDIF